MTESAATAGVFRHVGFFYRTAKEYATTVASFLAAGLAADEPAFAAVPAGNVSLIADPPGADARHVEFKDMTQLGRNLAWSIPLVLGFAARHAGRQIRYGGELIWAARRLACPLLVADGDAGRSPEYAGPFRLPSSRSHALPAPPQAATIHTYRTDLAQVRALVLQHAMEAGLPDPRATDLVLAVSEVAANTLRHTPSDGTLTIWHDLDEIICEIHDDGVITDPLAGRRRPAPDAHGGHGLWLVYQVCDLVELRSGGTGTTIRMHMAIRPPRPLG